MEEKMSDFENKILDMLEEISGDEVVRENRDINLLEEELIDSLDYVELLMMVQDEFGLVLSPTDFTREEMDTPNKVINSIKSRM